MAKIKFKRNETYTKICVEVLKESVEVADLAFDIKNNLIGFVTTTGVFRPFTGQQTDQVNNMLSSIGKSI